MENHQPIGQILIILTVGLVFGELAQLELVGYDDVDFIDHPAIQDGVSREAVHHAFTSTTLWHPLTWLSHALDHTLFGSNLAEPHLVNGALHLASCLMLFAWLRRFVVSGALALIISLLFAVHPMRVESVAWLAERKDVLATFFYLATVYAYSIWASSERPRRGFFWLAVLAALLGTLSKPSLVTLPIALLLIDAWPLDRLRDTVTARLLEKWPFFLLSISSAVVTLIFFDQDTTGFSLGWGDRIGLSLLSMATYTWRTFWPVELAAFEPMHTLTETWPVVLSGIFLGVVTFIAIRVRTRFPAFLMGWIWWLAILFPVSGIAAQSDHFAPDRYTYLAHIGLFILLVTGVARLAEPDTRHRALFGGLAALVILFLGVLTFRQVGHWKNAETLWRHALTVTRENHVAHHQLGIHLLRAERTEEGLTHLRLAVAATPGFSVPRGNLALALARNGHPEEAFAEFRAAGPDLPQREKFIAELEQTFTARGEPAPLREILALQIEESPEDPAPLYRMALSHLNERDLETAQPLLERTLRLAEPGSLLAGRAHHALAQAHTVGGDFAGALAEYAIALPLNPDLPVVRQEYAQLLINVPDPALRDAPRALELMEPLMDSNNPRFLRTLVQAKLANDLDATPDAKRALEVMARLRESDPLPQPWTESELTALQDWFQQQAVEL